MRFQTVFMNQWILLIEVQAELEWAYSLKSHIFRDFSCRRIHKPSFKLQTSKFKFEWNTLNMWPLKLRFLSTSIEGILANAVTTYKPLSKSLEWIHLRIDRSSSTISSKTQLKVHWVKWATEIQICWWIQLTLWRFTSCGSETTHPLTIASSSNLLEFHHLLWSKSHSHSLQQSRTSEMKEWEEVEGHDDMEVDHIFSVSTMKLLELMLPFDNWNIKLRHE